MLSAVKRLPPKIHCYGIKFYASCSLLLYPAFSSARTHREQSGKGTNTSRVVLAKSPTIVYPPHIDVQTMDNHRENSSITPPIGKLIYLNNCLTEKLSMICKWYF